MPKYKFLYFNVRGRGEISRLIFAYANVPYDDVRIEKANWPNFKQKMPFGEVPVLEVDGQLLPQSLSIAKYLAKEFRLDGKNSLESAFCDAMVYGTDDTNVFMRPWKRENDPTNKEKLWNEAKVYLAVFLDR